MIDGPCSRRPRPLALWGALFGASAGACAGAGAPPSLPPPVPDLVAANEALGDPYGGRFPIEEALAGLPSEGELRATLLTDEGEIHCTLDLGHAPLTVASFVGLARGLRPFQGDDGAWHTEPFYDGVPWHRAEEGQFVQTGRRGKQATGGFLLQDELSYGDSFDRAGVLAMGNTGLEHSGSTQFFITTGPASHLEGAHTIFGQCDDEAVVRSLERRVARGGPQPMLQHVEITRE
ncbi:MAG: peptidylprolyl isomerase [Myxococcales bacterium]|nr:peptidylprolyl isomerase [Myxococcales bacterium]MCB9713420.1 peptidylprolyl isomerase [Myxococcales bacterium]